MQAWQLGRRALRAAAAIGATLALAPAWAHADTVLVQQWIVEFRDDPGEASNVTVTAAPGEVRITQLGDAIVTADPACSGSGTLEVTCADPGISLYDLKLDSDPDIAIASGSMGGRMHGGEGADRLTGSDENAVNSDDLAGGDGNDLLDVRDIDRAQHLTGDGANGGAGSDTLTAGNGDDTLAGDEFLGDSIPGSDVITSGGGDDFVTPGGGDGDQVDLGPGDDRGVDAGGDGSGDIYEGGPGFDEISFGNTTFGPPGTAFDAFAIDLAAGFGKRTNNGPEANSVVGFEDVLASVGDDDITGASGPNVLDAGEGNDVVNPLAGADHVLACAGDDRIDTRDGFQDRVQCHAGIDTVAADQFDELSSCENVSIERERPAGAE